MRSESTYSTIKSGMKRNHLQSSEGCNLDASLSPLNSCSLMLQRCAVKKTCISLSLCHRFYSSRSPTPGERCCLPRSLNPTPPRAYASVHHTFSILLLLFCFWDSGDIFKVPDPCLETLCMCPHLSAPKHTHTHTEQIDTLFAWSQAPLCSSTSEKLELGIERRLWWILCSACQCCSFDLQPADDRSTLSS